MKSIVYFVVDQISLILASSSNYSKIFFWTPPTTVQMKKMFAFLAMKLFFEINKGVAWLFLYWVIIQNLKWIFFAISWVLMCDYFFISSLFLEIVNFLSNKTRFQFLKTNLWPQINFKIDERFFGLATTCLKFL